MSGEHETIVQAGLEFNNYRQGGTKAPFSPSKETDFALHKLIRELESRRQIGKLTSQEQEWLREIDALMENMTKFNQKLPNSQNRGGTQELVYDVKQSKFLPEEPIQKPINTPNISEYQAEQIISNLNRQFEEKVLKKLKKPVVPEDAGKDTGMTEHSDFSGGLNAPQPGRNLRDYLSEVQTDRPNLPFMDEDSHMDLGKLVKKSQKNAAG